MDQAGVIRCVRGLPRQPDKPDASGWPGVISLREHVVDVLVSLYLLFAYTPPLTPFFIILFIRSFSPLIALHSHHKHRGPCSSLAVEEPVSQRKEGKTDMGVVVALGWMPEGVLRVEDS